MRKIFMLDGGAGRIIAAIPALEKYAKKHPDEDWYVFVHGWDSLLWSNKLLQDRCFNPETKGMWKFILKDADIIVSPEPYRQPSYFRQEKSLAEAFDEIINETNDHSDLEPPKLYTNKIEKNNALKLISDYKETKGNKKTIVIQPFGRAATLAHNNVLDEGSRSLTKEVYLKLVNKLQTKYNTILFAEEPFHFEEDPSLKVNTDLRMWSAIIEAADYFVGCDSLGQHMARAHNKKGTVIIGSTFPINTSYPDWFTIWENKNIEKFYNPIRMTWFDGHMADRLNEGCADLTDSQINEIYQLIENDLVPKQERKPVRLSSF